MMKQLLHNCKGKKKRLTQGFYIYPDCISCAKATSGTKRYDTAHFYVTLLEKVCNDATENTKKRKLKLQ